MIAMMHLLKRHWLSLFASACLVIAVPVGCTRLGLKERELVFRVEPGPASWFGGLPEGVQQMVLTAPGFSEQQTIQAWWWPSPRTDAPAALYLHGSRWNLTGQLSRIRQLRALGFSVLAIDYRGFGDSLGDLPSERSVYQDARIAWRRLTELQPVAARRFIYGHSLGGAIAVNLATELADQAHRQDAGVPAAGLIIESTFTNLGDVAQAVSHTALPIRWLLQQKFDSLEKIGEVGMPVLIVHGTDDRYVPPYFSQELFDAARPPKKLLLVHGGNHNDSMRLGQRDYQQALHQLFRLPGSG
jgi:hypothetical protein